jgi:hypothetical protein
MSCARLAVFGALLTAACAPRPTANTDHWIASHRYVCDDGTRLTINWGREEAEAVFGNRRWRLRRALCGCRQGGVGTSRRGARDGGCDCPHLHHRRPVATAHDLTFQPLEP